MPYGCGEQNMVNFVPNILVLDYLKNIKQLTTDIETKAKSFLNSGYQRQLTYRHSDGSFSTFGEESDRSGSTWLTAFVVKSLHQAKRYIDIEPKIIETGLRWLSENQASNGSFNEVGTIFDKSKKLQIFLVKRLYTLISECFFF
jgi:CD109 antigen